MIEIRVDKELSAELEDLLRQGGFEYQRMLMKSAGVPDILLLTNVVLSDVANLVQILMVIRQRAEKAHTKHTDSTSNTERIVNDAARLLSNPAIREGAISLKLHDGTVLDLSNMTQEPLEAALKREIE